MKRNGRRKLPKGGSKNETSQHLHQGVLKRNFAFAMSATALEKNKTENRREVVPFDVFAAGKTAGTAVKARSGVETQNDDI